MDTTVRLPIVEDVVAQEPPSKRQCLVATGYARLRHGAHLCSWALFCIRRIQPPVTASSQRERPEDWERVAPTIRLAPVAKQMVELLNIQPEPLIDVSAMGPKLAIRELLRQIPGSAAGRREWLARARISAVLGSCPRSVGSFRSGERVVWLLSFAPPPMHLGVFL